MAPLYLAEMAPAQSRGTMNVLFQLMITIGCGSCPLAMISRELGQPVSRHTPVPAACHFYDLHRHMTMRDESVDTVEVQKLRNVHTG